MTRMKDEYVGERWRDGRALVGGLCVTPSG